MRYARAATARRSPRARLYSAVPRSSQCPSIVMVQLAYFFNSAAFALSVVCPCALTSLLSSSKNSGCSGELRLMSSSEAERMASSFTGSGGTIDGSATGSGGAGGRVVELPPVAEGGGGTGRTFGAVVLLHAPADRVS